MRGMIGVGLKPWVLIKGRGQETQEHLKLFAVPQFSPLDGRFAQMISQNKLRIGFEHHLGALTDIFEF